MVALNSGKFYGAHAVFSLLAGGLIHFSRRSLLRPMPRLLIHIATPAYSKLDFTPNLHPRPFHQAAWPGPRPPRHRSWKNQRRPLWTSFGWHAGSKHRMHAIVSFPGWRRSPSTRVWKVVAYVAQVISMVAISTIDYSGVLSRRTRTFLPSAQGLDDNVVAKVGRRWTRQSKSYLRFVSFGRKNKSSTPRPRWLSL